MMETEGERASKGEMGKEVWFYPQNRSLVFGSGCEREAQRASSLCGEDEQGNRGSVCPIFLFLRGRSVLIVQIVASINVIMCAISNSHIFFP